jgi:hypothetical protein
MNFTVQSRIGFKPVFVIVLLGLLLVTFAALILMQQNTAAATTSPDDSGYAHGCNDAKADDHPYLNSPGHGPNFHTGQFMQGYNDGFNTCGGNQGPPDSARSHQYIRESLTVTMAELFRVTILQTI